MKTVRFVFTALLPALIASLLLTLPTHAASYRIWTCKGHSQVEGFRKLQINILQDRDSHEFKATLSEGFTAQIATETWKVSESESSNGKSAEYKNLSSSSFHLTVDKTQKARVDNVEGFEATANLSYVVVSHRAGVQPKVLMIEASLACRYE